MASRRRSTARGVTGALCLARPAMVRRRSRSDDGTAGPNRAKTNDETPTGLLCAHNRGIRSDGVMALWRYANGKVAFADYRSIGVSNEAQIGRRRAMLFKSQAQRRKFAQLLVEGKISNQTFEDWNRETGSKRLPERVSRKARPARGASSKATRSRASSRTRKR